jgi:hypothetical protein
MAGGRVILDCRGFGCGLGQGRLDLSRYGVSMATLPPPRFPPSSPDGDQFIPSDIPTAADGRGGEGTGRPWLGVRFLCSGAYQRVYRNREGTAYVATCPRCGKSVRFDVGPGGTNQRFFEVSC